MYKVGASISRLATRLQTATARNSRRNCQRTLPSSLRPRPWAGAWMCKAASMRSALCCDGGEAGRHRFLRLRLTGLRIRLVDGGEHLVARAERLLLAVAQQQYLVRQCQDAR